MNRRLRNSRCVRVCVCMCMYKCVCVCCLCEACDWWCSDALRYRTVLAVATVRQRGADGARTTQLVISGERAPSTLVRLSRPRSA